MNLASRDIRHSFGRFVLTTIGLGLLLMLVMGMGGIYQGMIQEATLLVDRIDADLWVVQKDTRGPFAEVSRVPANLENRVRAVPGVLSSGGFVSTIIQREWNGRPLRFTLQGLAWPEDRGQWLPIVAGRILGRAHYEMIADESLKLPIGEKVRLGKNTYTVIGHTRAMTSTAGDPMAFFTLHDAQAIQFDRSGEAIRLERSARYNRAERIDLGRTVPQMIERGLGPSSGIPALGPPDVSAVLVTLRPGADLIQVRSVIAQWPDVSVYSSDDQRQLLVAGMVDKARRQIGLFRILLIIISGIIMALILYTLTLDKLHDIAMLKLMGARNGVILGLILQQALLLGGLGYLVAYCIGLWVFPLFPRAVIIIPEDLWLLGGVVAGISILASLLGIVKALNVEPSEVLS
ncbi:MAG: ABC transporter permease [FCB group bacterium]|nr:ABC transporter permease [FCB group bacterium]